ncbi:hypothetical protein WJX73_003208 [Symbiochloris irregularis]|uniref:Uncharacterized protein n=1 Tax=Symbiochloris irregularis TaxID=706552 RepID=A0AAW1NLL5_9CHLO
MVDGLAEATKRGSLAHVQSALAVPGRSVDWLDKDGSTALHHAVCRSHVPIVKLLLEAGASSNLPDSESGWTALHAAFYFGHLRVAASLFQHGCPPSLATCDFQGRTALDLLACCISAPAPDTAMHGEAFAWGLGANYQLGTGAIGFHSTPVRLEDLHGRRVVALAASKLHSAALTADGMLYTWGFGRGGRLGHPEFEIHSGKSAVIVPRAVDAFARCHVRSVSVAKHHSAAVVSGGDLYTWGSNRDGRLGYTAVDSQPVPRRVAALKGTSIACVAAANRHTVAGTTDGRVFSWGSNLQGQLGYGTSDSASNATPRVVEVMKGKEVTAVAAAKRHTVLLTVAGEVYTWGHKVVTPRRIQLAGVRDIARCGPSSGTSRQSAAFVAAGKYRTAVVTRQGTVYIAICPVRVEGIQQVAAVAVGEKHSLALQRWHAGPPVPLGLSNRPGPMAELTSPCFSHSSLGYTDRQEEQDWSAAADNLAEGSEQGSALASLPSTPSRMGLAAAGGAGESCGVPSLQRMCEACVADHLAEPRTALQLLEFADAAGARALFEHALMVAVNNMVVVLMEAHGVLETLPLQLLSHLEQALQGRLGPRPSSPAPRPAGMPYGAVRGVSFSESREPPEAALMARQVRTLRKKLQQIDALLQRSADTPELPLDPQQHCKVALRPHLQSALDASLAGASVQEVQSLMDAALAYSSPSLPSPSLKTPPPTKPSSSKGHHHSGSKKASSGKKAQAPAKSPAALRPASEPLDDGGLSLFLAGDLERAQQQAVPSPSPPVQAPSPWRSPIPMPSLRHIQSQEAAASTVMGSSPPGMSLRDIQAQQEQHRESVSISRSLGASGASPTSRSSFLHSKSPPASKWVTASTAAAPSGTSPGHSFPLAGTSPSQGGSGRRFQGFSPAVQPQSRWYIQDQQAVQPLQSIQTEETARKELVAQEAPEPSSDPVATTTEIDASKLPDRPRSGRSRGARRAKRGEGQPSEGSAKKKQAAKEGQDPRQSGEGKAKGDRPRQRRRPRDAAPQGSAGARVTGEYMLIGIVIYVKWKHLAGR